MKFSAFVRIRPGGVVEPEVRSDYADCDDDVLDIVTLALAPLEEDE